MSEIEEQQEPDPMTMAQWKIQDLSATVISIRAHTHALEQGVKVAVEALKFYSDHKRWIQCEAHGEVCEEIHDGDPMLVFKDGQDHPWSIAREAGTRLAPLLTTPTKGETT